MEPETQTRDDRIIEILARYGAEATRVKFGRIDRWQMSGGITSTMGRYVRLELRNDKFGIGMSGTNGGIKLAHQYQAEMDEVMQCLRLLQSVGAEVAE